MLRHILTMLALITGLAATAAPTEARVARADGVQVQVAGESVVAAQVQVLATREIRENPAVSGEHLVPSLPLPRPSFAAPSVRIGIDRARE